MTNEKTEVLAPEDKLYLTSNELRDFFELSYDLMAIANVDGHFKYANPAFEKILGWKVSELSSSTFLDLVHPDDRQKTQAELDKLAGGAVTIQFQDRYRCQDGGYKWLVWNVRSTADGWLHLVARDATTPVEAEQAASYAGALQQAILDNAEYSIISTTAQGIIQTFNRAAEHMLGYSAGEVVGKESLAFIHDLSEVVERAQTFSEELGIEIEPGFEVIVAMARYSLSHQSEWTYIRKDNSRLRVQVSTTAFFDSEVDIAGFLCIAHDITERKQTEAILAKQAKELVTVAEISTSVSTITESQRMLQAVADLTKERFDLYHVHVYLLNDDEHTLVLTAGSGEVGRQMVASGWQIPLETEHSLIAQAACTRQGVIANNLCESNEALPHPFLFNTRSELVVPILSGDKVLGVFDLQADSLNRFAVEDIRTHETLAAQVAVALQNAHSFERAEQAIRELNTLTRHLTGEGWADYLDTVETDRLGFAYDLKQLWPIGIKDGEGDSVATISTKPEIEQRLSVQGETVGTLWMVDPQSLTDESAEIVDLVAQRLSAHLENLRLSEQSRAALAEVQQSQEMLRTVIDATPDWIFIKDREHRFRLVNQGFANSLQMAIEDIVGKNDLELGIPEDVVKGDPEEGIRGFWPDENEVIESGKAKFINMEPIVVDGQQRYLSTIKVPVRDTEGKVWGVLGYFRDITEREQLLAEVQRLAAIVENHPDFIGVGSPDGEVLYVNPSGLKMMGLPPDHDATTMSVIDFYPAPDAERLVKEGLPTALERGGWSAEANLLKADGTTIPVEKTIGINYDADENPDSFSITMRDITGRKEAEEALRQSETRLRQVTANVLSMLYQFVLHLDGTAEFPYISAGSREIYELEPEEIMNDASIILSLVHPDDAVAFNRSIEVSAQTLGTWRWEGRVILSSGQLKWLKAESVPQRLDNGDIVWNGVLFDITEQKHAEAERERLLAELQNALEEASIFRQLVENVGQGVGLTSLDGRVVYVNPALARMVEEDREAMVGKLIINYYLEEQQHKILDQVLPELIQKGSWKGETTLISKRGKQTAVLENFVLLHDKNGKPLYVADVATDITERKAAEAERERLLAEVQQAYRQYVRQEWERFLSKRHQGEWHIEHQQTQPYHSQSQPGDPGTSIAIPISIMGQVVGTLRLQDVDPNREWTAEEIALIETVSEQLGLTIENLRLFEDTQRTAWRDRVVSESTAEVWSSAEIEEVMKAAVKQIGDKLKASEVVIRLGTETDLT